MNQRLNRHLAEDIQMAYKHMKRSVSYVICHPRNTNKKKRFYCALLKLARLQGTDKM